MAAASRAYPLMTRDEIEGLISEGWKLIIIDQHVVKADPWLKYHPGGDTAILHMVGRDATDETTVYAYPDTFHNVGYTEILI
jgi:sphingolipid 8-(E)-desaturase